MPGERSEVIFAILKIGKRALRVKNTKIIFFMVQNDFGGVLCLFKNRKIWLNFQFLTSYKSILLYPEKLKVNIVSKYNKFKDCLLHYTASSAKLSGYYVQFKMLTFIKKNFIKMWMLFFGWIFLKNFFSKFYMFLCLHVKSTWS